MARLLAQVRGLGIETADMLVHEPLARASAGSKGGGAQRRPHRRPRRERPATPGDRVSRARRAMIQLAWRFLMFQKDSALAQWYRARTEGGPRGVRKTMIVALARKLLIALWRMVTTGEVPAGVLLHPAR